MSDFSLVSVAVPPLEAPFTYRGPQEADVGTMVRVPLGRQQRIGWVISKEGPSSLHFSGEIKEVLEILDNKPVFHPETLRLFQWCAEYYGCSLSQVIDTAVPPFVAPRRTRYASLAAEPTTAVTGKVAHAIVKTLQSNGGTLSIKMLEQLLNRPKLGSTISQLTKKGILHVEERPEVGLIRQGYAPAWAKRAVSLNPFQEQSFAQIADAITGELFSPFLLYGVTGSGKTEVYIEAILHAAELGKAALIIVPEIALTPQLVDRFRARIPLDIAVLHSGLSPRERWDQWMHLSKGSIRVALGARSAVFAPLQHLGVVIVDEEHDPSFKQSDGLRYHGRDLAVVRAQHSSCPVILGSATPSLETILNVSRNRYRQLSLPERHSTHGSSPVTIINMNELSTLEKASPSISLSLLAAIQECLFRGEQAFILHNRRGFSSYLQCEECGTAIPCPDCSVTLTYHKARHSLLCHLCGFKRAAPDTCPKCPKGGNKEALPLRQCGSGTERIFEELTALLPDARIGRLDRDTADCEASHREVLDRVRSGETQILVGTQMLAKGHDLPLVTLVGVIDADVGLHLPDFRASERVFQLLTQVSGRAGRGELPGTVIIQTRQPSHPSVLCTAKRNYFTFAGLELQARKELLYPPFSHLLRLVVSSTEKSLASTAITEISQLIRQAIQTAGLPIQLLGPSPAPFERVRARWRFHCLLKSRTRANLHRALTIARGVQVRSRDIRVTWDVDPYDML